MRRSSIVLCLGLAAAAFGLAHLITTKWREMREHEEQVLSHFPEPTEQRLERHPVPTPVQAVEYLEVAEKNLFSPDRTSDIVVVAPPPAPDKPMPPLPTYFGQMNLARKVVILSLPGLAQKAYSSGESIGDFTLRSFDRETIELEWQGHTFERGLKDLKATEQK